MRFVIGFSLTAALMLAAGFVQTARENPAVALAQAPDVNQNVLTELKNIRATLSRLVELTEAADKSQRAALALQQVQVYDNRLKILRAEQNQLRAQEWDLDKTAAALSGSLRTVDTGIGPNGLPLPEGVSDTSGRAAIQEQSAAVTRTLREIRDRQRSLEQEIAALQSSLAKLEKFVGDVVDRR